MFRIQQNVDRLTLDLSLDVEDLSKEIKIPDAEITKNVLQQYLNGNTSFFFNQQKNELSVTHVNRSEGHFKIKAIFKNPVSTVEEIEIINTCLLTVPKQSNIIQLDFNQTTKDFRMHQQRQKINVTY